MVMVKDLTLLEIKTGRVSEQGQGSLTAEAKSGPHTDCGLLTFSKEARLSL